MEPSGPSVTSEQSCGSFSTSLNPPVTLAQARAVLPNLSPAQLECAALWIDEARTLQDHGFSLRVLVDRMWGLTPEDEAFAKLRLYGPFTVEWIQQVAPRLSPTHLGFIQRVVEHNRLVMEGRHPASLARMAYRLITPDLLVTGLFGLSASQHKAIERRIQRIVGDIWDPSGSYPYTTERELSRAAARLGQRPWWHFSHRPRPATILQVRAILPRLSPQALEWVEHSLRRRIWRQGGVFPSIEDIVVQLERRGYASDEDICYARKRLGWAPAT